MPFGVRMAIACLTVFAASFSLHGQDAAACQKGLDQIKNKDYVNGQASLWNCVESGSGGHAEAFYLTLTYRVLQNYGSGLEMTEAALKRSPNDVDFLYLAAYLHYRRNETKASMLFLSKAYRVRQDDWRVHQLFALNYIIFKMPDAVELELSKAISLNPGNAELHYQLGRLYYSEEHFQKSIEEVNRAIAITPDYPQAFDSLGLAYEALQNFERAGESYRKAIELEHKLGIKDEWPLIDYGTMLFREESAQAGLPYLLEAVEINPLSAKANYQTGRAMRSLKRYDEAEKFFEKTIAVDTSYAYAYYQLGTLVRERGDGPRAALLMEKYKSLIDSEKNTGTYNPSSTAHMAR